MRTSFYDRLDQSPETEVVHSHGVFCDGLSIWHCKAVLNFQLPAQVLCLGFFLSFHFNSFLPSFLVIFFSPLKAVTFLFASYLY